MVPHGYLAQSGATQMGFRVQRDVDRLSLPAGKDEHFVADEMCAGLYVRLQGTTKTWVARFAVPGKGRRKMKLGDVAGIGLAEARKRAAPIIAGAKDGADPLAQRKQRAAKRADTVGALVALFLANYAESHQRPRTLVETKRALNVYLAPLHPMALDAITRRDVAARFMALVHSSGPITANRTRAALSRCFSWAMQQGLVENNPVIGTARPALEVSRHRVLSDDELRRVWNAAGDDGYGRIVRTLILTGQRRDEVGGMAEIELDRDRGVWVLPAERTKNGREHEVPLAPLALAIIGECRTGKAHVFGRGLNGFSGWSQSKSRLDQRIAGTGAKMKPWAIHDLRRSVVTGMAEIGIAPHVVEGVVNHISGHKGGVAGVYNHATYRTEKRAGLERWAQHVEALVR